MKTAVTDRRFSKNSLFLSIAKKYYRMVTLFFLLADGGLSVFCGHFSITHLESNENMAFFLARTIGPPHIEAQTAQNKKGGGKFFKGRRKRLQ